MKNGNANSKITDVTVSRIIIPPECSTSSVLPRIRLLPHENTSTRVSTVIISSRSYSTRNEIVKHTYHHLCRPRRPPNPFFFTLLIESQALVALARLIEDRVDPSSFKRQTMEIETMRTERVEKIEDSFHIQGLPCETGDNFDTPWLVRGFKHFSRGLVLAGHNPSCLKNAVKW